MFLPVLNSQFGQLRCECLQLVIGGPEHSGNQSRYEKGFCRWPVKKTSGFRKRFKHPLFLCFPPLQLFSNNPLGRDSQSYQSRGVLGWEEIFHLTSHPGHADGSVVSAGGLPGTQSIAVCCHNRAQSQPVPAGLLLLRKLLPRQTPPFLTCFQTLMDSFALFLVLFVFGFSLL